MLDGGNGAGGEICADILIKLAQRSSPCSASRTAISPTTTPIPS
ncbi:MAG: hypothetical protein ACLT2T_05730 [Bilophila wadsworthia]